MNNTCCSKCHDVYFEKDYPAHTAYDACVNLKCECHSTRSETIKQILLPCELVPDLEAQVSNQLQDLLSTELQRQKGEIAGKIKMMKRVHPNPLKIDLVHSKVERKDMAINLGYNSALNSVLHLLNE